MRIDLQRGRPTKAEIKRAVDMRAEKIPWSVICKRLHHSEASLRKARKELK